MHKIYFSGKFYLLIYAEGGQVELVLDASEDYIKS